MPKFQEYKAQYDEIQQLKHEAFDVGKVARDILKQELGLIDIDKERTVLMVAINQLRAQSGVAKNDPPLAAQIKEQLSLTEAKLENLDKVRDKITEDANNPVARDLDKLNTFLASKNSSNLDSAFEMLTIAQSQKESNKKNMSTFQKMAQAVHLGDKNKASGIASNKELRDLCKHRFDECKDAAKDDFKQLTTLASSIEGKLLAKERSENSQPLEPLANISAAKHLNINASSLMNLKEMCRDQEQKQTASVRAIK